MATVRIVLFLLVLIATAVAQECDQEGNCDKHERCPIWKEEGECNNNKDYMRKHCPVTCGVKPSPSDTKEEPCKDRHERCTVWKDLGECETNKANMHKYCPVACGICSGDSDTDFGGCQDTNERCSYWAKQGECSANSRYMEKNCPKSCGVCDRAVQQQRELQGDAAEILKESEKYGDVQTADGDTAQDIIDRVKETIAYMNSDQVMNLPAKIRDNCKVRPSLGALC